MWLQKVRNAIRMPLKSLFLCCKITNIAQWLGAPPPGPGLWHARVASVCLAQGRNYTIFVQKKTTTFVSPLFSKILFARLAAFIAAVRVFKQLRRAAFKEGGQEERQPLNKNPPTQTPKRQ